MATKRKKDASIEMTIEDKLSALYELQQVSSSIDKIRILRGELPLEVQDLEDEIEGLTTRIDHFKEELEGLNNSKSGKSHEIIEAQGLIKKYEEQQKNVRNNREFDSISKEIEYQTLEIQLCEKKIREFTAQVAQKEEVMAESNEILKERIQALEEKKGELDEIIADTQKEEEELVKKSEGIEKIIEPRLLTAFKKIRSNARNGLAVVPVERDACGGCFNKIPPQRQLDIRSRKKVIVCEYCGRILVDSEINMAKKEVSEAK